MASLLPLVNLTALLLLQEAADGDNRVLVHVLDELGQDRVPLGALVKPGEVLE